MVSRIVARVDVTLLIVRLVTDGMVMASDARVSVLERRDNEVKLVKVITALVPVDERRSNADAVLNTILARVPV